MKTSPLDGCHALHFVCGSRDNLWILPFYPPSYLPPAAPHPPYEPSGQTARVSSSVSAPRAGCCPGSCSPSLPLEPNGSRTSLLNLHVQPQRSPLHEQGATEMSGAVAGEVMGIHTPLFLGTLVVEAVAGSQFCGWGD